MLCFFFLIFKKLMGRKREANKQLLMDVSDILKSGWRGGHVSVKEKKNSSENCPDIGYSIVFQTKCRSHILSTSM